MKNLILYLFWSAVQFIFKLLFDRKIKWETRGSTVFTEYKGTVVYIDQIGTYYEANIKHTGEDSKPPKKYYDLDFAKRDIENILKERT